MTQPNLLILIPHPDDEVVGCAVALRRAVAAGAKAHGLYLTTGVPAAEALWPWQRGRHAALVARRKAEAEAVAAELGLAPAGFAPWPSRALKAHLGDALASIRAAIARCASDELWVPAWEGAHQDHDVANFLAAQFARQYPVKEFAEYNFHEGRVASGRFPRTNGAEETIRLTPAEAAWKRALLARYRSERRNLAHIRVEIETLRPLAAHDYSIRPHPGPLFYERFQWVPFRHPRVDFDRPESVLSALRRGARSP